MKYLLFFVGLFFSVSSHCQQVCKDSIAPSSHVNNFTIHGDGTVTHNTTGLMWMRCSLGQNWGGGTCSGDVDFYLWEDALDLSGMMYAGYEDWRLPNRKELASIIEERCHDPSINLLVFPNAPGGWYWSSTPSSASSMWRVNFDYGIVGMYSESNFSVRLVRDVN